MLVEEIYMMVLNVISIISTFFCFLLGLLIFLIMMDRLQVKGRKGELLCFTLIFPVLCFLVASQLIAAFLEL